MHAAFPIMFRADELTREDMLMFLYDVCCLELSVLPVTAVMKGASSISHSRIHIHKHPNTASFSSNIPPGAPQIRHVASAHIAVGVLSARLMRADPKQIRSQGSISMRASVPDTRKLRPSSSVSASGVAWARAMHPPACAMSRCVPCRAQMLTQPGSRLS